MLVRSTATFLAIWIAIFLLADLSFGQQQKSDSDSTALVTDVKPGIKRYGNVPEFAGLGQTRNFDVSPDGETLVFTGNQNIKFWDLNTMKVRDEVKLSGWSSVLEYSSDGLSIYSVAWDGKRSDSEINILDGITGQPKQKIIPSQSIDGEELEPVRVYDNEGNFEEKKQFHVQHVAISPDDKKIAVGSGQFTMVFDIESAEKLCSIKHKQWVQTIAFSPDGNLLIDGSGKIFDVDTGKKSEKFKGKPLGGYLAKIATHPKRDLVATASWNSGLLLYDLKKNRRIDLELPKTASHFYMAEFSGNGTLLAGVTRSVGRSSNSKPRIIVWDVESAKITDQIKIGAGHIVRMRFAADNESIFTKFSNQFGISHWKLNDKGQNEKLQGHDSPINRLWFSADNRSLTTIARQGGGLSYDLKSGKPRASVECNNSSHLAGSKDGRFLVAAANYNSLTIYNNRNAKSKQVPVRSYQRPSMVSRFSSMLSGDDSNQNSWENFAISDVTISDDDERVMLAMRGQRNFRMVTVELATGKLADQQKYKMKDFWSKPERKDGNNLQPMSQLQWQARTATVSPNGQMIAIINDQHNLFIIDAETKVLMFELGKLDGHNPSLRFTPDSARLVAGGSKLMVWDTDTGEQDKKYSMGGDGNVRHIEVSGNGSRLVASRSNQIKVLDLQSGDEIYSAKTDSHIPGIGISDDGKLLAIAKPNCQFEVWDLDKLSK